MPYTVQKNVCITFGSRVRLALENVLRFAGVMPRTRDSSAAYIFETSTISLRLNRWRNWESISRYACELYGNLLALLYAMYAAQGNAHCCARPVYLPKSQGTGAIISRVFFALREND